MPGSVAPLKKPGNTTRLPLALDPLKSKDVLAVLAERNQAIVPVGAWVEPASPHSSEIPAYTSAYMIEEELKEQLRKKQEALKHFQRQVKRRVNQQIRLRKKQQLQKSYEAAEKESSIAMQSSDPAHLTPKRTSIFPNNLNAAIGSARLPPSEILGDGIEDRENQNELFQQQAQALSQTTKQARHQLASFKIVSKKNASVFPDGRRKSFPTQEEPDSEESSSLMIDEKGRENLFWGDQQDLLSEDKDKPFIRVQKVQFKNPLFAVMEEEELKQLHLRGIQDILPETQDYLPEAQGDLLETQGDLTGTQSIELEAQSIEPDTQSIELEAQAIEPKAQAIEPEAQVVKTETQSIMLEAQSIEPEDRSIALEVQDFQPRNRAFLPKDQNILPKCQDQHFLCKDQDFIPKDQNILPTCQDQAFLPKDQHVLPKDQNIQPKCQDQDVLLKDQHQDFLPKNQRILSEDNILSKYQDQHFLPKDQCVLPSDQRVLPEDQNILPTCQDQDFLPKDQGFLSRDQKVHFKEPYSDMTNEKGREDFSLAGYQYLPPKLQDQAFIRDQNTFPKQPSSFMREDGVRDELPLEHHQYVQPKIQDQASSREQNKFIKQRSSFEKWGIERGIASGVPLHRNHEQASHKMTDERWRKELLPECREYVLHEIQDPDFAREQSLYFRQQPSVGTAERWREDLLLEGHQHLPPKHQREASSRRQVYDEYQSGLNTEFQTPLALQSGVDQEEDKKEFKPTVFNTGHVPESDVELFLNTNAWTQTRYTESVSEKRQKQYLRHRRLFMDIEREQVKEQQRQKEYKKKIEKIKKKKEQERYAEEQRLLRMNLLKEPYSGEKMSEILAQLQLEEIKGAREKQQQREKEYQRYLEALRAQIQEKMQLYKITLPPLCCCGPDFWDAHPDTCANNCIFYKNHRAYTRALHSVISSCDIPEGNSALRVAIHNFASAHRRTLKNL
ncbi:coiled-coil domain-containing protein 15 isoform X6 [Diceros bicornis minor]|uniref:coiled-coil domain-containing protein 15 isoform X6 n=1 Tax=Diceros bicornis minor TaxID=77932 RepID=UPI0026EC27C9|nr:coiled-coil domain-containing protein 15 isoform X6 [Diceros bicornis minor]